MSSFDLLEIAVYGLIVAAILKVIATAVLYRTMRRTGVIEDWKRDQLRSAKRRKPENRTLVQKYLLNKENRSKL